MWLTMISRELVSLAQTTAPDDFLNARLQYIEEILAEDEEQEGASSPLPSSPSITLLHRVNPSALQAMETSFFQTLTGTQPRQRSHRTLDEVRFKRSLPISIYGFGSCTNNLSFSSLDGNAASTSSSNNTLAISEHALFQFQKGVEEASRFLPSKNLSSWSADFDANVNKKLRHSRIAQEKSNTNRIIQGFESHTGPSLSSAEEDDLLQKFHNIFLDKGYTTELPLDRISEIASKNRPNCLPVATKRGPSSDTAGSSASIKEPLADLHALLMDCARCIRTGNHNKANRILIEIRQHSSPLGDGSQRVAHYFANGIEARLAGTGAQLYCALRTKLAPPLIDMVKAKLAVVAVFPFKMIHFSFLIHHISNLASKATTVHIIEFGIEGGIQVSRIIDHLNAKLSRSPPKVRITGIEDPEASEMVKKTGYRLVSGYNVEYNGIAQKWETISKEDLKIKPNEAIAVICALRFHKLLDSVVQEENPPRTKVLNLIREISPDIFLHFIANGSYNIPLFFPRFKESTFHYWAWFDMLDNNLSRYNADRLMFERFSIGPEIMNTVACEGPERVERAETYRQWQNRTVRAGFKVSPVDKKLLRTLVGMVREGFHKEILIEEEEQWILQGWKGRTLCASSCWIPD